MAQKGTVKWFNDEKGYGFITPDGGAKDVFVHYSAITGQTKSRKSLQDNDRVEFDVITGTKGKPEASNVVVIA